MSNELKPCPFCGSTALRSKLRGIRWRIECVNCGSVGPVSHIGHQEKGVEAWNKRRADGLRNFLDAEHKKAFGESKLQAAKAYFAALIQFDKLLGKSMGLHPKNEGKQVKEQNR